MRMRKYSDCISRARKRIRKKGALLRIFTGFFCFIYFSVNTIFAYSQETNVWEARRHAVQDNSRSPITLASLPAALTATNQPILHDIESFLNGPRSITDASRRTEASPHRTALLALLPLLTQHGTIQNIALAPRDLQEKAPIVVYIQDIHQQKIAQRSIGEMVVKILEENPNALLGLEGGAGAISTERYRGDLAAANRELGAFYLNGGYISGAEYAALAAPQTPRVVGVEDEPLYLQNVSSLKRALSQQGPWLKAARGMRDELEAEKSGKYSPALLEFDGLRRKHERGELDLGTYLTSLRRLSKDSIAGYRNLSLFLEAWRLETTLDFSAVERERKSVLEKLTRVLPQAALKGLLQEFIALQSGRVTYPQFHQTLAKTIAGAGIDIKSFPAFANYIDYVFKADQIHAKDLFEEIQQFEISTGARFARSDEERALLAMDRRLGLLQKLISLSMTREDWKEWNSQAGPHLKFTAMSAASREKLGSLPDVGIFENFYEFAERRNNVMAQNLWEALSGPKNLASGAAPVAVLVAGGYHADEIASLLIKKHATVVMVTPKWDGSGMEKGDPQLSIFTREKLPLESLFEIPRITLAAGLAIQPPPGTEAVGRNAALEESQWPLRATVEMELGRPVEPRAKEMLDRRFSPWSLVNAGEAAIGRFASPARSFEVRAEPIGPSASGNVNSEVTEQDGWSLRIGIGPVRSARSRAALMGGL
jgi:hypothetical protein